MAAMTSLDLTPKDLDEQDLTELTIHTIGLRIANTLKVQNKAVFIEDFKSGIRNLNITEIVNIMIHEWGGYKNCKPDLINS